MLSAFLALGNAFGTHKTGHFLKKRVILRPQRFAKRLKMAGYNSEERAQPVVCVRLSNLLAL